MQLTDQTPRSLSEKILEQTRHYLNLGATLLRRPIPAIPVTCDLRGRAAGQVRWQGRTPLVIRYNLAIAGMQPEEFLAQTVPHEVAHVITGLKHGKVQPHGPEWRAVMRHLGVTDPQRCHSFKTPPTQVRRQHRWAYRCACMTHELSATRHNRVQRGEQTYLCRRCGEALQPVQESRVAS